MRQTTDQTLKGAIAAFMIFLATKFGVSSDIVLVAIPVVTGVLAWLSQKFGDPTIASFLNEQTY